MHTPQDVELAAESSWLATQQHGEMHKHITALRELNPAIALMLETIFKAGFRAGLSYRQGMPE